MTEQRCLHDLLPGQCAVCKGTDRDDLADFVIRKTVRAQYATRCQLDKTHGIEAGDEIGVVMDVGWLCTACTRRAQEAG